MKKSEKFVKKVLQNSESDALDIALQDECIIDHKEILEEEEDCACGQHLKAGWWAYYVLNVKTKKTIIIGSCCVKKLNPKRWNTKKEYLYNALALARNDQEKEFVMSLINKLTKWGSGLIISKRQAAWLESITNKEWKWKTWRNKVT
jgi:hypothetical protein